MINPEQMAVLRKLQSQVQCPKGYICIHGELENLCEGRYYRDIEVLECLDKSDPPCAFVRAFGCTQVCACPLRKLIAKNFDQWSAESTVVLRQARGRDAAKPDAP